MLAKAHQADCGNALPTTYMGAARDVYEEGALIFPAVKVQADYERQRGHRPHVRDAHPRARSSGGATILAMLGAARIGERELLALGEEVGWDTLDAFAEEWFDYCEQRMVDAIRAAAERHRPPAAAATIPFPDAPDGIPIAATVDVRSARRR